MQRPCGDGSVIPVDVVGGEGTFGTGWTKFHLGFTCIEHRLMLNSLSTHTYLM